jgi:K+:H+ antiporter
MESLAQHSDLVIAVVMVDVAVVLLAGAVLGTAMRFLRQPPVMGEIIAGIALGPSLLGLLPGNPTRHLFPAAGRPLLAAIAQVGLLIFMFGIGWEFEKRLLKGRVAAAGAISLSSTALTFTLGVGLATMLYGQHSTVNGHHVAFLPFALFMGAGMSITAFPVLARILTEHGILKTPVGTLALASAAVGDVLAWCMLALVAAIVTASSSGGLLQVGALSALYIATMLLVIRPLLGLIVRRWARERLPISFVMLVVAGVFLSSYVTTWIGIHAIFGAFIFGCIMPREPYTLLREGIKKPFDNISMVLLPVFFIVTGLNVDIGAISGWGYLELAAIVVVACAGKFLGVVAPAKLSGTSWRDAGTLGLLMNARGLTELIILNAGVGLGVLDGQMFTMMVLMAVVTTLITGPLLPKSVIRTNEFSRVPQNQAA